MLFLWLHPLHWAVERLAGAVCGEGDRRENGRKAEYVGLVGLHLFLTPLCRFEIFLIKISKQYACDKIRTQQWKVFFLSPAPSSSRPPAQGVIQSPSPVHLFSIPWTAAHQASLFFTNCRSLLKPTSIELVMPSNHLNLCHPLLLPPSIFLSIRVFSNESALRTRRPKYWSFSFRICPSNAYLELNSFRDWLGEGDRTPLQYSCLENPMDGGAWWAAVHGVARSRTWLSDFTFIFHFHALEKEVATHSSVLAWRIPGTGEPGGLPSMGSHRVGHDWSDLAAGIDWLCNLRETTFERMT